MKYVFILFNVIFYSTLTHIQKYYLSITFELTESEPPGGGGTGMGKAPGQGGIHPGGGIPPAAEPSTDTAGMPGKKGGGISPKNQLI